MSKQNGNTLLELLLVIAVSSVLIILAVRYFAVVDLNMRVAEAISKIDVISRASYEWLSMSRQADFEDISLQNLIESELIEASDHKNPWGGVVEVAAADNPEHVRVTLKGLSAKACHNLRHHLKPITFTEVSASACKPDAGQKQVTYWGEF